MTLVKINHEEYGLEENKAKQISDMFKPMLDKMEELEVQFNHVIGLDIEPETIHLARDLRLQYVKVRTGTDKIHKELKSFYLQGGRFVDGWRNAQKMASQGNEEKLKAIEDHFVNIEKERIQKLQEERAEKLREYDIDFIPDQLGEMADDVWGNYISGVKLNYEAQKEAERKAEEERVAKEKAEAAERERIRLENEKLRKEVEEREAREKAEAQKRAEAAAERIKKEEAERKAREEKERKEREAHEAALKKEREERERVEAELKRKADEERKAREEKAAAEQAELNKSDKAKVADLISDLKSLKGKYQFKSQKNKKMYLDVAVLIDKVIKHIES